MKNYQKIETPQLIELDGENGFIIATSIDLSQIKNKLVLFKGKSFNYDEGEVKGCGIKELQYSLEEEGYYNVGDENEKEGEYD